MAYPERGLLEQHLVGHNLERRFICDICNAALKRKDHLTRHKQSHNPERPFVCNVHLLLIVNSCVNTIFGLASFSDLHEGV